MCISPLSHRSIDSKVDLKELILDQILTAHAKSLASDVYLLYGKTMDHFTMQVMHEMVNKDGIAVPSTCDYSQLFQIPGSLVRVGSALGELTSREMALYCYYKQIEYQVCPSPLLLPGGSVYRLVLSGCAHRG